MKIFIISAILLFSISAAAQTKTFFQTIAGNWEGALEYRDYQTDKRVKLKTFLTVTVSSDGNSAEFQFAYDDVSRVVKDIETEKIDATRKKYVAGDSEYEIDSTETGKIVLLGKARDGDRIEPVRKTIVFDENSIDILKETGTPFQFRNQTILKRSDENVLAKRILTAAQTREDLEILKRVLTTIHPGIYRYQTVSSVGKIFADAEAKIKNSLSESEFFVVASQIVNQVYCGHTFANPYNQDIFLRERLVGGKIYLPFYFRIVDGKFILTENASNENLSKGSEITKINGIPAKRILETLLTITKGDGRNTPENRIQSLELTRFEAERYAAFDWYFPLFFPLKNDFFTIEAVDFQTKKNVKFETAAMTKAERTAAMAKRYGASPTYDDGWKFSIEADSTAYLKIDNSITWRLKTIKFKEFLADAFAEMRQKNTQNLIIDLRGNGGGDMNIGFELSKYLTRKDLPVYAASHRLVRNVAPQTDLLKFLDTYSDELKMNLQKGTPSAIYKRFDENFFEILPNENTENFPAVTPYENNFRGRAFIVSDASNASATFQFLEFVKENKLVEIVGQTSGGNLQGINGGNFYFLRLPNSKIEIDVPTYFQSPLAPQKDAGVAPNISVKKQPEDIGSDFDRESAAIKKLIRR